VLLAPCLRSLLVLLPALVAKVGARSGSSVELVTNSSRTPPASRSTRDDRQSTGNGHERALFELLRAWTSIELEVHDSLRLHLKRTHVAPVSRWAWLTALVGCQRCALRVNTVHDPDWSMATLPAPSACVMVGPPSWESRVRWCSLLSAAVRNPTFFVSSGVTNTRSQPSLPPVRRPHDGPALAHGRPGQAAATR